VEDVELLRKEKVNDNMDDVSVVVSEEGTEHLKLPDGMDQGADDESLPLSLQMVDDELDDNFDLDANMEGAMPFAEDMAAMSACECFLFCPLPAFAQFLPPKTQLEHPANPCQLRLT